mgnify:CR=1 FL=1
MKNILCLSLVLLLNLTAFSQSKNYVKTMQSSIESLFQAKTPEQYNAVINKLERIAQAETEAWEPYYYKALAQVFQATKQSESALMDEGLTQALISVEKSNGKSENNAETIALRGFINMIKIGIDPATRGRTLGPEATMDFSKAIAIDASNPRAQLFMGQMTMGSAQFFGASLEKPCAMIDQSIVLFDESKKEDPLTPSWGKVSAVNYQEKCKVALALPTEE